jgi:hypothetical protein
MPLSRPLRLPACALALALALAPRPARAEGVPSASAGSPSSPFPPAAAPPPGLENQPRLRADDEARKREGHYFTGLPFFNYDPSTGFGFGARAYFYEDGQRTDPLFAHTPYLHRVIVQGFLSTAGVQDQMLDYDAPRFLGSPYRLRATFEYEASPSWPYFGLGARSLAPLSFPGAPGVLFARSSDYDRAAKAVQPDGTTYALYNAYGLQHPTLQVGLERAFLGGLLRPAVGLGFSYSRVTDYTGRATSATGASGQLVQAPEATTLLAKDCAAGRALGCGGGFDNVLRLSVSVDTRDLEPDPNAGIFAELITEIATRALGSQYEYLRAMISVRGFYSPIPELADLVVAARGVYEVQTRGAPFFSQTVMPFLDGIHFGLGGARTLRGFAQNRFVGPVLGLFNLELRWTFVHFKVLDQELALMAVPFLDMGRVFDDARQTSLAGWKRSQGGGLRLAWNEATIVFADLGVSQEDVAVYVNFNHIF